MVRSDILIYFNKDGNLYNDIYEALYSGLPVITYNNFPYCEIIKDGKNGWLVNEKDNNNIEIKDFLIKILNIIIKINISKELILKYFVNKKENNKYLNDLRKFLV